MTFQPAMIRACIFDLGNVLINFDHGIAAAQIARECTVSPQEIFQLFFDSGLVGRFEEGKISPRDFFVELKNLLGLRLSYEQFVPVWNQIFFQTEDNKRVYQMVGVLRKRYKTALVSNINILHFSYIRDNFKILDEFDTIVTSYEAGVRKPAASIYEKALSSLGVSPQEAFYTDDRSDLIDSARMLGIHGVIFQGARGLHAELRKLGVSTGEAYA